METIFFILSRWFRALVCRAAKVLNNSILYILILYFCIEIVYSDNIGVLKYLEKKIITDYDIEK